MTDWVHHAMNWVDHNRYLATALGGALAGGLMLTACQPRAVSPFTGELATQRQIVAQQQAYHASLEVQSNQAARDYQQAMDQLKAQAVAHQAQAQAALEEIAQRKLALQAAMDALGEVSSLAGPGYGSMLGSALGVAGLLLGLGASADGRRKDRVIAQLQEGVESTSADQASVEPASVASPTTQGGLV